MTKQKNNAIRITDNDCNNYGPSEILIPNNILVVESRTSSGTSFKFWICASKLGKRSKLKTSILEGMKDM